MKTEEKIIRTLTQRKETLSIAESCTGGLIAQKLTAIPGASSVFGFGVVSYSGEAKQKLLGISPKLIQKYGEVSKEVADAMARGILNISKSDYGISVTGIAGPTGGTKEKPAGTIYFSLISKRGQHIKKGVQLKGDRNKIRKKTSTIALNLLYSFLNKGTRPKRCASREGK